MLTPENIFLMDTDWVTPLDEIRCLKLLDKFNNMTVGDVLDGYGGEDVFDDYY